MEFYGLTAAVWAISYLPYGFLRTLADLLGSLVYACDARGRRVAQANLESAFPGPMTARQKARIIRRSYQSFARTMVELFWAPNLTRATFDDMDLSRMDQTPNCEPTIYLCLHASNFEMLSLALPAVHGPGMVVTQRLKNPLLGPIFDRLRGSTGHEIIPQERAMIRMFRHLKNGGYFCMLIDLNLDPSESSVVIEEFGGLKTCVTQMHAALAMRTGARIIPAECRVQPDGRYQLIYYDQLKYPHDATAGEIAQLCWNALESSICERPESWLWSYKHWRFKPAGGDSARYPFYANTAKRFDKLIASQEAAA